MLKRGIILFPFFIVGYISGQSFTELATNIEPNGTVSISYVDFDNDNDLDVLVSGSYYTNIYRNNGSGIFTDINAGLPDLSWAASDWGDYDNDGDPDLILTGKPTAHTSVSYIYRNDGVVFTDIEAKLQGFGNGSAEWGDYDNDGDLDLLLCGEDEKLDASTKIYINEGDDDFSLADIWLPGVSRGSATWGDFDNDHDLDVLICGKDISGNFISAVYRNDINEYSDIKADLYAIQDGIGIWVDNDSDGDLDIFISGRSYSKIYQNNGNIFNDIDAEIFGMSYTRADWGDFNNDGMLDIIATGLYSDGKITAIFGFNKNKEYTLYDSSFTPVTYGEARCADFDDDNDLDVVLAGYTDPWDITAGQYRNNAKVKNTAPAIPSELSARTEGSSVILSWNRSSDSQTPANGISYNLRMGISPGGIQVVSPMSHLKTGKRRVVSLGNASSDTSWVIKNLSPGRYYWSVQAIDNGYLASPFATERSFTILEPFTDVGANIDSVFRGSVAWGDYDNDNDFDLAVTGTYEWHYAPHDTIIIKSLAKIYRNDSNTEFTEVMSFQDGLYHSDSRWGDYDNDGDLDLLMTGEQFKVIELEDTTIQKDTTIAMIYKNAGMAGFRKLDTDLKAICNGTGLWTDFDNDGDLDVLLSGYNHEEDRALFSIYRNDGNDIFVETVPDIGQCRSGRTACFDADNDGDTDIFQLCNQLHLYKNSGNLQFYETELSFSIGREGLITYGDYDNDKDLDLLLAGYGAVLSTKLLNNDEGTFIEIESNFRGVSSGSACWGDYDIDGDLDFILTGQSGRKLAMIYCNEGYKDVFTEFDADLIGIQNSDVEWGDYDNDGDLDVASAGSSDYGIITKVYKNNGNWENKLPNTPENLHYEIKGFDVFLKWDHCTDGDGVGGVTYNVRIDTIPGGGSLTSVMSDLSTGYRMLPVQGNAGTNNFYLIKNLPFDTYYWSVQAVDNTYKGGSWAEESSFELGNVFVDFEYDTICFGEPTTFTDRSMSRQGAILSWQWDFGDGGISSEQHPQYFFAQPGEKNVKLTIVLATGSYYKTKKVVIKPKPGVQFTFEPVSESGEIMTFENQTDTFGINISDWIWDFGDNNVFIGKNPPQHGYLSTGTYTVQLSVISSNGCADSMSKEIQVCQGILQKPELLAYGPNTWYLVCSNDTAPYYRWYYNGNQLFDENSHIYVANEKLGEYQVAISNDDECFVPSEKITIPVISTGTSHIEKTQKLYVYPNPTSGTIQILYSDQYFGKILIRISNMAGRVMDEIELYKNHVDFSEEINLQGLKVGLYILEFHTNQYTLKERFIMMK